MTKNIKKEKAHLDSISELIWVDTEQAWLQARAAMEKYKTPQLTYSYARAQMLVFIISRFIKHPIMKEIDVYSLKAFFDKNKYVKEASALCIRMIAQMRQNVEDEAANALDEEWEQKYATRASLEDRVARLSTKADYKMMRELNKSAQMELALEMEKLLEEADKNSAWYRASLCNALRFKAEALSHLGEEDMVKATMDRAVAVIDVPGTSPFLCFNAYYFRGNVDAVAGRNEEALKSYCLLEERFAGRAFYDQQMIYVYIQIFKQLNDIFSKEPVDTRRREDLIVEQTKYLTLAKSLLPSGSRPYIVHYLHLSEARLMRATRQYAKAISLLARALPFFSRSNINNHVIDIWEEAYQSYQGWAAVEHSYTISRKANKALTNVNTLTHRYDQAAGKEKMDAVVNKYELQKKELSEKLLHEKMDAMNKEMQLTALNLHEKVTVLDELKTYVTSLKQKGKETNQLISILAKKIDTVIITEQDKSTIQQKIDETNKDFFKLLSEKYPQLSGLEIRMCGLLKTGLTDKELSKLYGQNERSYEQQRYRIKKKMGLVSSKTNLIKFLMELK